MMKATLISAKLEVTSRFLATEVNALPHSVLLSSEIEVGNTKVKYSEMLYSLTILNMAQMKACAGL
jgi:hypothetical protein